MTASLRRRFPRHPLLFLEHLEDRTTPASAEFQVNTITEFIQTQPTVASATVTGHSVVGFLHTDGLGTGFRHVYARMYDRDGFPLGPEFKVNETGDGTTVDVAMDADGDFVVVWQGTEPDPSNTTNGISSAVYARRFNAAGVPQGGEFVVPSLIEQPQRSPTVAMDALGGFTVVWEGAGARIPGGGMAWDYGIHGRRFNAAGVPQEEQFLVVSGHFNGAMPGVHALPDVASGPAGDFVVAWEIAPANVTGSPNDILVRRYSAGGAPLGNPERMNTVQGSDHVRASVAALSANDFIVTWHEAIDEPGLDNYDVYARRITPTSDTGQFPVNAAAVGQQRHPKAALDGAGRAVVAWEVFSDTAGAGDGNSFGVFARRFERDGTPMEAEEFGVNLTTVGSQASPAVAATACGDFMVLWQGNGPAGQDQTAVFGRIFVFPTAADNLHTLDSDGDAIPDCWELHGYSVLVPDSATGNPVAVFVDLRAMGADPLRKDLFVEIDWMQEPGGHSHEPKPEALAIVRDAFARAPVPNPDGSTGITLHIDAGRNSLMDPGFDNLWNTPDDETWGDLSGATILDHVDELSQRLPDGNYDWTPVDGIKNGVDGITFTTDDRFSPARAAAFHYCRFIHNLGGSGGTSGISRNGGNFFAGAGDFIVSLGSWTNGVGTALQQAGTFMHELGHNLGLSHGGGDDHRNHKPNYLSVMNYSFQTRGLLFDDPNQAGGVMPGWFDYSRIDLPDLDENHLDETIGLRGTIPDPAIDLYLQSHGTYFYEPFETEIVDLTSDTIDWDDDGQPDGIDIDVNINKSRAANGTPTFGTLPGAEDWSRLVFTGGGIGQLGASLPPVMSTPVDSITFEENSLLTVLQGVSVSSPTTEVLAPGDMRTLSFTVRNLGTSAATFDLVPSATRPWANFSGVPATLTLATGASQVVTIPVSVPAAPVSTDGFEVSLAARHADNTRIVDEGRAILGDPETATSLVIGGSDGVVRVLDNSGAVIQSFRPLDVPGSPYDGLVQVALGDLNGDGKADVFASAANPAGVLGLDAAKAGRVFVFDGATLTGGTPTLLREFVPFATHEGPGPNGTVDTTGVYVNGLNIAVGDVNGDGKIDLIAGTRGATGGGGVAEYGRLVVIDGGTNALIGGVQKPFGPGYQKGVVVAAGNVDGTGGDEIAVTRGGPVASKDPSIQKIKVKVLQLQGGALTVLHLATNGSTSFAPFGSLNGPANAIKRDGRVTFVDTDGDGDDELVFSALDPLTNPSNGQVRVAVYSINVGAAMGAATIVSAGSDSGTYLTGKAVMDHAITHIVGTGTQQGLAIITESSSPGIVYLAPLTGVVQAGGFALGVLHGGITLDGI